MNKLLAELLYSSKSSIEQKDFVFFNENSPEGYTSQVAFLASLRKQKLEKPFRVDHLKKMFDNMSLNRKLLGEPSISNDEGQEVIWLRFGYGNIRQNLQILNECGLFQFVTDYANGIIKNVPTFEMLINSIIQE